ncbi:hypothetical protein Esti_002103 [Eimeria stiedai]
MGLPPQGSSPPGVAAPHAAAAATEAAAAEAAAVKTGAAGSKPSYVLPPGFPMPHTNVNPTCVVLKQLEDAQLAKAKTRAAAAAASARQPNAEGQERCPWSQRHDERASSHKPAAAVEKAVVSLPLLLVPMLVQQPLLRLCLLGEDAAAAAADGDSQQQQQDKEHTAQLEPADFIDLVLGHRSLADEFCYMNRIGPYSYKIVPFHSVNPCDYLTLSSRGVIHYRDGRGVDFLSLQQWKRDQELYTRLASVRFFRDYEKWRMVAMWKAAMMELRFRTCAEKLEKTLFSLDRMLRPALLAVRSLGLKIVGWQLLAATGNATVSLQQLEELQKSRRQQLSADIKRVWAAVIAEIQNACANSLHEFLQSSGFASGQPGKEEVQKPVRGLERRGWRKVPSAVARRQHRGGGGEGVSYTEKATTRMQCRRLVRFIRVAEYMFDAAMIDFARAGTKRLTECLALFENAAKEGTGVNQQQKRKQQLKRLQHGVRKGADARGRAAGTAAGAALQLSPDKAVLTVQMELGKNGVSISPSKAAFKAFFNELLQETYATLAATPSFRTADEVSAFTTPLTGFDSLGEETQCRSFPLFLQSEESGLTRLTRETVDLVDRLFDRVARASEDFSRYAEVYISSENLSSASLEKMDVADFDQTLSGWQRDADVVGGMQPQLPQGFFSLDISKLQKTLLPSVKRATGMIQGYLLQLANTSMTKLLKEMSVTKAKLSEVPDDIDTYVDFNCFLVETRKTTFPGIEAGCFRVSEVVDLLKRYSFKIDATTKTLFAELSQSLAALRTQLQFAAYSVEGNIKRFQEELQAAVPEAKAKVAELQEELADPKLYNEETDVGEALTILQDMKKRIDDVAAEVDRCKRCGDILHLDATPFEGFEETLQTFEALESCLSIKKNWSAFVDAVGEESFWSADLQKIQASLQAFSKGAQSLASSLGSRPLFASLQSELSTFRSILVVAKALRNPALKERHWIVIQDLLGEEASIRDQSLLIKDLKTFKRLADTPDILTLSSDATAEETLEALLHSVRQTWDSLQLPLTTRRVSKDKVVILGCLDDVIATLDDSLVSVNTIAGSRFGLFIRSEIEALQSQLTVVQEALEEWQLLQTNWLGLQAIFSFPDIRKQLPSEAAKFASVDTQWRAISAELQEYNVCLAACIKEGRLATLKRLNNALEDIRRGLEDYLQASPRISDYHPKPRTPNPKH